MQQCPECWSGIDSDLSTCPHCGHSLTQPKSSASRWILTAVLILTALGTWFLYSRSPQTGHAKPIPVDPSSQIAVSTLENGETAQVAPDEVANAFTSPSVHWQLTSEGRPITVLLLASRSGPTGLLPLDSFPLEGPLQHKGSPVDIKVIHHDMVHGYVLLRLPNQPSESTALKCGNSTNIDDSLLAWTPRRAEIDALHIEGRTAEGLIVLDRDVPAASAIITTEGYAIAYALGGKLALPLDPALPWIDHALSQTLSQAQQELRAADPVLIARDATELMAQPLLVHKVREAIALLQQGLHLARDRELIDHYDKLQRIAWQNLVRLLAPDDSASAIAEARQALALFPDHKGLLVDTIRLMANKGDPLEAANQYIQLLNLSPDHAQQCAEILARALADRGRKLVQEDRHAEGLAQYARAVALFPMRADLHMAYANALLRSGNSSLALAHAQDAAALDPAFQSRLRRFSQTRTSGQRTVIPFDPRTNVINAKVTVGGIPLSLVVDTGATMTTIPTALADQLNLRSPANRRVMVTTASGKVEGEVVRLPSLQIGKIRLHKVEAVVMDLPNSLQGKGLLGMNALKQTQVQIDTEGGRLILERKRRKR